MIVDTLYNVGDNVFVILGNAIRTAQVTHITLQVPSKKKIEWTFTAKVDLRDGCHTIQAAFPEHQIAATRDALCAKL